MAKVYQRKSQEPYTMLTIRLRVREKVKLRILAAELDMSMQGLIKCLLKAQCPGVLDPSKQPRRFSELVTKLVPEEEPNKNNEESNGS